MHSCRRYACLVENNVSAKKFSVPIRRRNFLVGAGAALLTPGSPALASLGNSRTVALDNIHTGERLAVEYWANGGYLTDALAEVDRILRDFRSGEIHPIAPQLIDLLTVLGARLETREPFHVISGYRSPATNAMLRGEREHSGVASKSLHMQGMAIDIAVPGRSLVSLRDAALSQRGGGVGFYPQSGFVHVDVGRVRTW